MEDSLEKTTNGSKKIPIEELEQDELVKRCKSYLAVAQKAKQGRDELQQKEILLLEKISSLEQEILHLSDEKVKTDHPGNLKLEEENLRLTTEIAELSSSLKAKEEEINLLVSHKTDIEAKLKSLEENYSTQKDGFVEELNKMNDVLKQRGETITRLEEKFQTSENEFKMKTESLLQLVAEKERRVDVLEGEISRYETQTEATSTSTVSKAEEIHRMKDVEDSLEERYNKLKKLAVNMKRKISELNSELQDKDQKLSAAIKASEKGNKVLNTPLNFQAVQKDIDRLNDELDAKKKEISMLKKDCENAIKELGTSKERAEEFKSEVAILKSTISNLEKSKAELEKSNQELHTMYDDFRKENESDKILRLELSKECDRLRNEIQQLNTTIEELNKKNQVVNQEVKKQSLLQLELSDYEKTVADLNNQLDLIQKELHEKQTLLEQCSDERSALKAQVQLLEQQIKTEEQRINELKSTLESAQTELKTTHSELERHRTETRSLTGRVELKESELDNLKVQLSSTSSDLHKIQTSSSAQIEGLRKQIASLEESLVSERGSKSSIELQYSELRSEFENYKIRATSVLKKKQTEEKSLPKSGKDGVDDLNTDQVEREMLQRVVEALKAKIVELESQLTFSQGEVSTLRLERERAAAIHSATVESVQQRLERSETEISAIKREHQAQIVRLQGDNQLLASLHREQIDGLKVRHTQEILEYQNKLDEVGLEVSRLQKLVLNSQSNRTISPLLKDRRRNEVSNVERESGEGSEDGSVHHSHQETEHDTRKPMPLDLLLNSTLASEETVVLQSDSVPISLDQYNESLAILEKRCTHLASLLAESEANEARLSQLADALKEEIRRTERAEERQKHIENLEYLKNVVLKFVTLPRGEERSRLVPVLTTLLRLSPAEVQEVHQTFNRTPDGAVRPMGWGGVFNYFAPNQ